MVYVDKVKSIEYKFLMTEVSGSVLVEYHCVTMIHWRASERSKRATISCVEWKSVIYTCMYECIVISMVCSHTRL